MVPSACLLMKPTAAYLKGCDFMRGMCSARLRAYRPFTHVPIMLLFAITMLLFPADMFGCLSSLLVTWRKLCGGTVMDRQTPGHSNLWNGCKACMNISAAGPVDLQRFRLTVIKYPPGSWEFKPREDFVACMNKFGVAIMNLVSLHPEAAIPIAVNVYTHALSVGREEIWGGYHNLYKVTKLFAHAFYADFGVLFFDGLTLRPSESRACVSLWSSAVV